MRRILLSATLVATLSCGETQREGEPLPALAPNPFITHLYTADPSARVWDDGRLYLYPSHDIDPPRGCDLMDKYHVFSTDDLLHWTDHGQIVEAADVPWGRKPSLADGATFMWAPDCIRKNGRYYFYFPHPSDDPWNSNWRIGIAVSDRPASGFTVLDHWLEGLGDDNFAMIDPNIFVDDDGQAYFYYGGGGRCAGARLHENMTELAEPLTFMTGLNDFHEAAWVFKRNGTYYLTYADNHTENGRGANRMRYAVSNKPLGPWAGKGVFLGSTSCDTSHGSVVEYKGEWYVFYHSSDLSGGRGNLRSVCVDRLGFNEDGTIRTVRQTR
ncbi:MAG: family 43 glycosylhydrolase [Proteiniphilum sp.]|jgi:beta-xylosidase|nr:family 43 glycosylhydrolase [Proteiniphilum sp.]